MVDFAEVAVLKVGNLVHYIVPSFPVIQATLREVKLQWKEEDGALHVFDAFARDCDLPNHPMPAIAKIPFSFENAFMIKVKLY